MPELPDIEVYVACLRDRILDEPLENARLQSPSLLRSVDPRLEETFGRRVTDVFRLGKRIALHLEGDLFLVLHLMIAGRLQWKKPGAPLGGRRAHAGFDFPSGTLTLTEASTKKRASLHVLRGSAGLAEIDPGGLEVMESSVESFGDALTRENHTLKRALTDPHLMSGIGNAYSDEILHRARLSPVKLSQRLDAPEIERLHSATLDVLAEWTQRLLAEVDDGRGFPAKVTAFRREMAVHGRFRQACPDCTSPVQRIVRGDHETNYCPTCQTGGKVLADRALSKLLKQDWPRSIEELERRRPGQVGNPSASRSRRSR